LVADALVSEVSARLRRVSETCKIIYVKRDTVGEPERGPRVSELGLHPMLARTLEVSGIGMLYGFQYEAYRRIMDGKDIVIVSGTATGKTEAFLIPLMDKVLKEGTRAVVIYPTKALARDQLDRFLRLSSLSGYRAAIFDGDVREKERRAIAESPPHVLITNPDMIHFGLVQSWRFRKVLRGVKIVVLDEAHVYEGAFGSHMRMVIERLKLSLGEDLQLVASSATIGNPEELGNLLFGREVSVVQGARRRRGLVYHAMVTAGDLSRWTVAGKLVSILSSLGLKTLTFVDSQQMAEVVARIAKESGARTFVHRAGLTREDRIRVEGAMKSGEIDGVVATPTLELGIDVGTIDSVVMVAPPPSYTKYLQRAGRAGRRRTGYIFLILGNEPIDAYYERSPPKYFRQSLTPITFEPANDEIVKSHVLALSLQWVRISEKRLPAPWADAVRSLVAEGFLEVRGGFYRPTDRAWREFRSRSLRSAGPEIAILESGEEIGRRELPAALHDLHPHAIYMQQGVVYEVLGLDLERRVAEVKRLREDWPYYTRPLYEVSVREVSVRDRGLRNGVPVAYGEGVITRTAVGYATYHIYGEGPEYLETLEEPVSWSCKTKLAIAKYVTYARPEDIHALEHVIIHAARPTVGAGIGDLGGISYPSGHVVIYDSTPGGSGLTKLLYERLEAAHRVAYEILSKCECEDGCPRCVYDPFCGNGNRTLSREGGRKLIERVLRERTEVPADVALGGIPIA